MSFAEHLLENGGLSLGFYVQPLSGPSELLDLPLYLREASPTVEQVHLIDPVDIPPHITEIEQPVVDTAPCLLELALQNFLTYFEEILIDLESAGG